MQIIWIATAGGMGVLSRFLLQNLLQKAPAHLPIGTLFINVLGSFAIGIIWVYFQETHQGNLVNLYRVVGIGFLGGFTTFSGYTLETALLLEEAHYFSAFAYFIGTPFLCFALTTMGMWIGRQLF